MNHPTTLMLRVFLRSLPVADAGFLLHLLECPRCGRRAWKELSPRPMRRRPGERRPADSPETAGKDSRAPREREPFSGPAAAADLCRELARLRRDELRFEEALALFERAASLFGGAGKPAEQAGVLGELAILNLELREEEAALAAFERILAMGPAAPDPGLAAGSMTGIAGRLASLGDPLEGRRLLALLRERLGRRRAVQQRMDLLRQEGLLAAFTRHEPQAERFLRDAWTGYLRASLAEHAALTVVDLAALFMRQGRPPALRDLAAEVRRSLLSRQPPGSVRLVLDRLLPQLEAGLVPAEILAAAASDLAQTLGGSPAIV